VGQDLFWFGPRDGAQMGGVFDPMAALGDPRGDPYPAYERLRREAPAYHNEARGFWALSRFEDVRAASRDWRVFSNAAGVDLDQLGTLVFGPGDFLDTDPPEHDELRGVVRSRFTPKSIAAMEPMVERHVHELLAELISAAAPDLAEQLAWPLPMRVMCSLFGFDDRVVLTDLYKAVMERPPGVVEIPREALEAAAAMRAYFVDQAGDRRRNPRDDVMTQVAEGRLDGAPLPDDKVAGICFVLFSAGIDTVASLIGSAVLLLAQHPEQRALVAGNPDRLPAALEEVLRFESPLQFNARITTEPVTVAGVEIPAGERVLLLYGSANRDEERFEDPARFDVTRAPKRHLAFGEGIHFCIGAPLARLEAKVALAALLAGMPEYELRGPPVRLGAYNMRTLARIPIEA
jgi:cytochrome P450